MDDSPRRWRTPLVLCIAGSVAGTLLGAVTNAINDRVSSDYFSIVMSWDGTHSPLQAIAQGMLEGGALGLFFGFFFAIAAAASTRMRCPLRMALRVVMEAIVFVLFVWAVGGVIGIILAANWPNLWGFVFTGVPPRVNLLRFAWVGGSIWGSYAATPLAVLGGSLELHQRWKRISPPVHAFPILTADGAQRLQ